MIQQVNLYTQELRPRKERLQAGTLAGLVVLALLAVAVAAGMVRHEAAELDERVDAMVAENLRLEQRITDLSAQVQARQPSPDIREALDRVTATLVRRERVLERVENLVLTGGGRFSPQMAALARQIPEDVWLTGIRLDARATRMVIEGRARSGALVPTYLEKLGDEPVFAGETFGAFRLTRPEQGAWIEFRVATERTGETN